jgi:hypothetical protein
MRHVGCLAAFLGHELADNAFVPSIMWLPNEQDWRVRAAFYQHLPELAAIVVCVLYRFGCCLEFKASRAFEG